MAIESINQLKDYCLRKLGEPVINIEGDDTQWRDRINDALQWYVERHFDGVEEVYFRKTVFPEDARNGYVTVDGNIVAVTEYYKKDDDGLSSEVWDSAEWNYMDEINRQGGFSSMDLVDYYITRQYITLINQLVGNAYHGYNFNKATNRFYPKTTFTSIGSTNLLGATPDYGDWSTTNGTLTANDAEWMNGELTGATLTSDATGSFNMYQSKVTDHYVAGTYTAPVILKKGTYTGNVVLKIVDRDNYEIGREIVTPTNKWDQYFVSATCDGYNINDLKVIIESETDAVGAGETILFHGITLYKNSYLILKGYKAVSEDDQEVFDDPWMKEYATALMKQQWGNNIKKYGNMVLPSGITINGEEIYSEATEEISQLRNDFSMRYEMPDAIMIG